MQADAGAMNLIRFAVSIIAALLILAGLVATLAPTPFGFLVVLIGLILLAWSAPESLRALRQRWPWLHRRLAGLERSGPRWLARLLRGK